MRQNADLGRGQRNPVVLVEGAADLLALLEMDIAL
jgi:hypothetical protein